ncbi:aromatic-ring-hydroxylating dioxygenase subunit beta [Polycyclovorans algicola]|jgi:anthranilate 1,2-dioxygenase small subunit|uniref:aromatic-ring-hydroxylating dioxygenase subunit beta n=1 Tax=Polycyclovorans algicola TaxID=616992 RepID=UPI000694B409|nr:aromatic-ring-hydroxylating dioxygenase subunit beta [Polycyclovorans algicola]
MAWTHSHDLRAIPSTDLFFEATQLMLAYCASIDEDRLEDWPGFFAPDGRYELVTRENAERNLPATAMRCDGAAMMRDRVVSLRHANVYARQYYRHLVTDLLIGEITESTVSVASNYLVTRTLAMEGDPIPFSVGRATDTLVLTDQGLRFQSRRVVADNDRIHTLLVLPI